ncbi:hypothetical protein P0D69_22030 [Paraburkholderia sediminicola]|uniref:hypothetical protein n=1 Tax=Paraburkholderia sediminicola TaxID=458836 RepID=UPI0038B7DE56
MDRLPPARPGRARQLLLAGAIVLLLVKALTPLCHTSPSSYFSRHLAAYEMNLEMSLKISATLEGWCSENMSWHSIFWQNAVLAVPLILCLLTSLPKEPIKQDAPKGDYFGMMLGAGGLAFFALHSTRANGSSGFSRFFITICTFVGVTALAAFFIYELLEGFRHCLVVPPEAQRGNPRFACRSVQVHRP